MSNVSMINGHIDESKGTMGEIKTAMGCMSGYPCEECNIEECRVNDIPQPIIDLVKRLKADKEALIATNESMMLLPLSRGHHPSSGRTSHEKTDR